jgi:hypothetical protein
LDSTFELVESSAKILDLNREQLEALDILSEELSGSQEYWGSTPLLDVDQRESQIIRVESTRSGKHSVTVLDAVGALSIPGMTLIVKPKIPENHFTYIATRGLTSEGRFSRGALNLEKGVAFQDAVHLWFIQEIKDVWILRKPVPTNFIQGVKVFVFQVLFQKINCVWVYRSARPVYFFQMLF